MTTPTTAKQGRPSAPNKAAKRRSALVPVSGATEERRKPIPQDLLPERGLIGEVRIEAGPVFSPESRLRVRGLNVRSSADAATMPQGHRDRVAASFDTLVGALMPTLSEMDPVPYAIVQQAQRRAALRTELLASGAYTYRALAEGRAMKDTAVRQWVRRARERYDLFTVGHDNETLVPAFLLDADLMPRPEFRQVIEVLIEAGEGTWGLWAWFTHPTSWLDGAVPAVLITQEPEAVLEAARNRASNAA